MAFNPEEIKKLQKSPMKWQSLSRIERIPLMEASIAYRKIGCICAKAVAEEDALSARRQTRTANVPKFQIDQQKRNPKKGGIASTSSAKSTKRDSGIF